MNKKLKITLCVTGVITVCCSVYFISGIFSKKDSGFDETIEYEYTTEVDAVIAESTYVETIPESSAEYESIADAGDVISRISSEFNVNSPDAEFMLQTFVDGMQEGSLEHEFINEDMIQVRRNSGKSTVFISGYSIPGFEQDEVLLFDVYDDGAVADYEDWAVLDSYLYSIKDIGRVEESVQMEELDNVEQLIGERGTGTINQSFPYKLTIDGYETIDSRSFDNDDYCDTELPVNAYNGRFNCLVGSGVPGMTISINDEYAASLDVWNFSNAYAIPLTYDKYLLECVDDVIINDVHYNYIRISGDDSDMNVGKYGRYVMLVHTENGVTYSDFYICKE